MKVLYISTRPPYPKVGGREFMISQSLSFLMSEFDTHLICFHGSGEVFDSERIRSLKLASVEYFETPSVFRMMVNFATRLRYSLQENIYYSPVIESKIETVLNAVRPDVVVCDMLRTSQYLRFSLVPFVVDLDDVLSQRYHKMLALSSKYSALGTYAHRLPRVLSFFEGFARRLILKYECYKISVSEERAVKEAYGVVLTSPKEAGFINAKYSTLKAVGVSQAAECRAASLAEVRGDGMLFIGNLTTSQNIESLSFIVCQIMPALLNIGLCPKLIVVGKYDDRASKVVASTPCAKLVELVGFVDDLGDIIKKCRIAMSPVAFGTGVKTKVLDSMAFGLPTVTNSVGADGLMLERNHHAVIEDDPVAIAVAVKGIYESNLVADNYSRRGQEYITVHHSFDSLRDKYNEVVRSAFLKGEG